MKTRQFYSKTDTISPLPSFPFELSHTVLFYDQNFMGPHSLILNTFVKNFTLILFLLFPLYRWWKDSGTFPLCRSSSPLHLHPLVLEDTGAVHAFLDCCVVSALSCLSGACTSPLKPVVCPVMLNSWNFHGSGFVFMLPHPNQSGHSPESLPSCIYLLFPQMSSSRRLHGPPLRLSLGVLCPPPDVPRQNGGMDKVQLVTFHPTKGNDGKLTNP